MTELFIRSIKLYIFLVFITLSNFKVPKDVRLNSIHPLFHYEVPIKRELQQIALNRSSDIYKKCTAEPYSFLVDDPTLASDNPLGFRKTLFNI